MADQSSQSSQDFQQLIQEYISDLLTQMQMSLAAEEEKQLREIILEKIDRRILALVIDELSDQQFEEMMSMLEERNLTAEEESKIFAEASSKIPDFGKKFTDVLAELQTELLQDAADLQKLIP